MDEKERGHGSETRGEQPDATRIRQRDGPQSDARLDAALRASGVRLAPHAHQRDAVAWWVSREGTSEMARAVPSGGILADEMGLGKSMSAVMSVMFCRSALAGPAPVPRAPAPLPGTWAGTSPPVVAAGRASAGGPVVLAPTLIVCPKSLLIQWEREILRHTTLGPADIHLFYGRSGRRITRRQLTDKVFVLTTYEIVLGSFEHDAHLPTAPSPTTFSSTSTSSTQPSSSTLSSSSSSSRASLGRRTVQTRVRAPRTATDAESVLHGIEWDRIVLDEAHVIRNWQTSKTHRAVCALRARRRWCLTGTAFNNSASDVIALCRFVGIAPYCDPQWWSSASEQDASQWRTTFLLRRTKATLAASVRAVGPASHTVATHAMLDPSTAMALDSGVHGISHMAPSLASSSSASSATTARRGPMALPPKVEKVRRVALTEREAAFYDGLAVGAVADFGAFTQSKGTDKSRMFGQMLEWLTRLRQACCDPLVLKGRSATIVYSPTSRSDMARHESCCVRCHAIGADSSALKRLACGHMSCVGCANDTLDNCALCFGAAETHLCADNQSEDITARDAPVLRSMPTEPACGPSSRTASMVRFMNKIFARDRQCKMVVFSQWSTYLDLIESAVVTHVGVDYVRIDGAVRQIERRNALVNRFATDPSARCLLMTIGVGSVGLNLVCANYVLLMDAHYNPFAEAQAVDRVHRIGQTRPVRVVRFLSDASVDAAVAQIQAVKRAGAAAFLGGPAPRTSPEIGAGNNSDNNDTADGLGASRRGTAMPRGIDERQLRSILSEMIAARRDMGDSTLDAFVFTKSSSEPVPSRGMHHDVGITIKKGNGDDPIDDCDDDIDDDDGDYQEEGGDDDDDDGLDRRFDAHYDDYDHDDATGQQRRRVAGSDTDTDETDGNDDEADKRVTRKQADRRAQRRSRTTSAMPGPRCRFLIEKHTDGDDNGKGDDNGEYDIVLDDDDMSLGSLPRRSALHRLKRTRDTVRCEGKTRRLFKRAPHHAAPERDPAAKD
ncbi:ATP-dependent helicase rhp16 [Pandoravirus kuranda]|uniref:ATP-dependent helicase rhp16 n=1 Tax=Pandoravirus kuranda TaxID=3019033 RepID=A0AA95EE97_9VIRU|nr:ATP-dependent helicase rhp16 [Pandoravirus kuranda]